MRPTHPELVERILALRARAGAGRVLLGLVGEPGAGKSTLATSLRHALEADGIPTAIVPMDGFHLANRELQRLGRAGRKGAIDTFDGWGYAALLERLRARADEVVYAPAYERAIEESVGSAIPVPPEVEVILTEGNYLLIPDEPWNRVAALLDEVWFLGLDPEVRRARLLARHVEFGKPPQTAQAWVETVDESNAALIAATSTRADLVVTLD